MRLYLGSAAAALILLGPAAAQSTPCDSKPPISSFDKDEPPVTLSTLTAGVVFSVSSLARDLNEQVPKRLAAFHVRTRSCWHRRVLGRDIRIDCSYAGSVDRAGAVTLRTERDRLQADVPLFGVVDAQGVGGLLEMLHGTAHGRVIVSVFAAPRLMPDWSVALGLNEAIKWNSPPTFDVLGFKIGIAHFVEPKIREQAARVEEKIKAKVAALDLRGKAEIAWQHAFATMQLSANPEIWLRTTPTDIAFSELETRDDKLKGSISISGRTETVIGPRPPLPPPTALPALGKADATKGFNMIVPVAIRYDTLSKAAFFTLGMSANAEAISLYPSDGKIVIIVHPKANGNAADRDVCLVTAVQIGVDKRTISFGARADTSAQISRQVRVSYKDAYDRFIASATAQMNKPLGDGWRSEGQLTAVALDKIVLLKDHMRIDLRANSRLTFLYRG